MAIVLAVMVAQAGEVLLNQSYGIANLEHKIPNTSQTKFRIGSITKQFTAMAILRLQEQGLLGQSYPNYLHHQILEPLQMLDSGYDQHKLILPHRASGYIKTETGYENAPFYDMSQPSGAGAMYSTIEDLYKWDRALYTDKVLVLVSVNSISPKSRRSAPRSFGKHHYYIRFASISASA